MGEVFATAPVANLAQGDDYASTQAQDRVLDMCMSDFQTYVGEPTVQIAQDSGR